MARNFEGIYAGGSWVGTGARFDVMNPADGSIWAQAPDADAATVAGAIRTAHAAFPEWAALPFTERAHYMLKIADEVGKRGPDLVKALQGEGGGWFGKGMFEVGYVIEIFRSAAAANYQSIGEILPSEHGKISMVMRRPMGVVSVISPWNFPFATEKVNSMQNQK